MRSSRGGLYRSASRGQRRPSPGRLPEIRSMDVELEVTGVVEYPQRSALPCGFPAYFFLIDGEVEPFGRKIAHTTRRILRNFVQNS